LRHEAIYGAAIVRNSCGISALAPRAGTGAFHCLINYPQITQMPPMDCMRPAQSTINAD
jgi:hypothetical protein